MITAKLIELNMFSNEIKRNNRAGGNDTMTDLKCPCCNGNLKYQESVKTHTWVCEDCPIIMFEYYTLEDLENLKIGVS
jgi:ssDNA-binding Zn-finger/Zn-ribbon topoisomerase 1